MPKDKNALNPAAVNRQKPCLSAKQSVFFKQRTKTMPRAQTRLGAFLAVRCLVVIRIRAVLPARFKTRLLRQNDYLNKE